MAEDSPPADPDEAASFASDYGVSLAVAAAWLDTQDKTYELRSQMESTGFADKIAGYWFDNHALKLHVQVTDSSPSGQIRLRAGELGILGSLVIDGVPYTEAHLVSENQRVAPQFADLVGAGQLLMSADTLNSRLVWAVSDAVTATQLAAIQAAANTTEPHAIVSVGTGSLNTSPDAATCVAWPDTRLDFTNDASRNWAGCAGDFRGGIGIRALIPKSDPPSYQACSAGFNAINRSNGAPELLTAGHCVAAVGGNSAVWAARANHPADKEYRTLGSGRTYRLDAQTDYPANRADSAAIKYASPPAVVRPIVLSRSSQTGKEGKPFAHQSTATMTSVGKPIPGSQACVYGGRTGKWCSTLIALRGADNELMWLNSCNGRQGDSGSPVLDRHKAIGLFQSTYTGGNTSILDDARNQIHQLEGSGRDLTPNCIGSGTSGFQVAGDILDIQRTLSTQVLTYPWRSAFTSPKTNSPAWVRAVISWPTKANIDLHVWNATGGADLAQGHASSSGNTTFVDGYVSPDVKKYGPEQFVETGPTPLETTPSASATAAIRATGRTTRPRST